MTKSALAQTENLLLFKPSSCGEENIFEGKYQPKACISLANEAYLVISVQNGDETKYYLVNSFEVIDKIILKGLSTAFTPVIEDSITYIPANVSETKKVIEFTFLYVSDDEYIIESVEPKFKVSLTAEPYKSKYT